MLNFVPDTSVGVMLPPFSITFNPGVDGGWGITEVACDGNRGAFSSGLGMPNGAVAVKGTGPLGEAANTGTSNVEPNDMGKEASAVRKSRVGAATEVLAKPTASGGETSVDSPGLGEPGVNGLPLEDPVLGCPAR